jgi:DnaJ-class molecular chaperone
MSDDCKRCPKCEGSGAIGECVKMSWGGNMFIDYECPRCKGRGYVEKRRTRKRKGGEE